MEQQLVSVTAKLGAHAPSGWDKLISGVGGSPPMEVQALNFNLRIAPEGIAMLRAMLIQLQIEGLAEIGDTDSAAPSHPQ